MENVICKHCGGKAMKNGKSGSGVQRYICVSCRRTFATETRRYSDEIKAEAIDFYLNNCGVRRTAYFIGCSPGSVINWIRAATNATKDNQAFALTPEQTDGDIAKTDEIHARNGSQDARSVDGDIIEMDEIYTICLKKTTE
jgi:transposase-like protein